MTAVIIFDIMAIIHHLLHFSTFKIQFFGKGAFYSLGGLLMIYEVFLEVSTVAENEFMAGFTAAINF